MLVNTEIASLIITIIACVLNGANLYGYIRCRLQQPSEFQKGLLTRIRDSAMSMFKFGGSGGGRGDYMRADTVESF